MTRFIFAAAVSLVLCNFASAQIRGGANRGGAIGGIHGGGARGAQGAAGRPSFTPPAGGARPNMQRPSPNIQRPNMPAGGAGSVRPGVMPRPQPGLGAGGGGIQRPTMPGAGGGGIQRPNMPSIGGGGAFNTPNRPGQGGAGIFPSTPGAGGGGIQRPNLPGGGGAINFPNRPGQGGSGIFPGTPGAGGGGIQRPNLPGGGGAINFPNRPGTLPSRPGQGGGGTQWPNRPETLPSRPGQGGGGVQWPNRPETRPGQGGGGVQWPNRPGGGDDIFNRPGGGGAGTQWPNNRPNWNNNWPNNRPNWNNNNTPGWLRPSIGNSITNNNINLNRNFNTIAPNIYNAQRPYGGYFHPYAGNVYRPYGWANYGNGQMWGNYYSARYYNGWHNGFGCNWFHFPPNFIPRPVPLGWLVPNLNWTFFNPFWTQPQTIIQYVDYSQPLPSAPQVVPEVPTDTPTTNAAATEAVTRANQAEDTKAKQATAIFDSARELFRKGEYSAAETATMTALKFLPEDPTLHEFRALTLFAQGKFRDASAAIYAVLAAGPGWNAETLYSLYPDKLTYEKQLQALEKFAEANPKDASARFLLGYQYLSLGDRDKAIFAFQASAKLEPKDELSAQLAKNLAAPPEPAAKP